MAVKKYLLLSSYTWPETSGSGIHAYNFALELNQKHHAQVLSFKRKHKFKKDKLVKRIPYFSGTLAGKILSLPLIITYYLLFIIKTDILFIYGSKIIAWEIAAIIAGLLRRKIVFQSLLPEIDDVETIAEKSKLSRLLYRKLFKMIDGYFAINVDFENTWLKTMHNRQKVFLSPQGVNNKSFSSCSKEVKINLHNKLSIPSDSFIVLSAGFLINRKGINSIFSAISKLDFNYKYYYLGEHKFNNTHFLKKKNTEANALCSFGKEILRDNIVFTGFVQNINEYLCCADVLVHGGTNEGFPNVLLEAMASETPVICAPIKGLTGTYLINRENCLIYETEEELISAIKSIKENKGLREHIIAGASAFIQKKASFEVVIERLNAFLFK